MYAAARPYPGQLSAQRSRGDISLVARRIKFSYENTEVLKAKQMGETLLYTDKVGIGNAYNVNLRKHIFVTQRTYVCSILVLHV